MLLPIEGQIEKLLGKLKRKKKKKIELTEEQKDEVDNVKKKK